MFSQNNEDDIVMSYFGDNEGALLSIGENDGLKFSNAFGLIKKGWWATLVEPSKNVFPELMELHDKNEKVICVNVAIGNENGEATFYDSGVEEIHGGAKSLVATMNIADKTKWEKAVDFVETKTRVITFEELMKISPIKKFDFVSIDAEGFDLDILKQINLEEIGCRCLCIEYNSDQKVLDEMISYCSQFGLTGQLLKNAENIILVK